MVTCLSSIICMYTVYSIIILSSIAHLSITRNFYSSQVSVSDLFLIFLSDFSTSLSVLPCLSLSVFFCLSFRLWLTILSPYVFFVSVALSLSFLSLSLCLFLFCHSLFFCLSFYLSLFLSLSLFFFLSLYFFLPLFFLLSTLISLTHFLSVTHFSLSLSFYVDSVWK